MTLLLFLTGLTTVASTGVAPVTTYYYTVSGSGVLGKFPNTTVVSTYAPITRPTESSGP